MFGIASTIISGLFLLYGIIKCAWYISYTKDGELIPFEDIPARGFLAIFGIYADLPPFKKKIHLTGNGVYAPPPQDEQSSSPNQNGNQDDSSVSPSDVEVEDIVAPSVGDAATYVTFEITYQSAQTV